MSTPKIVGKMQGNNATKIKKTRKGFLEFMGLGKSTNETNNLDIGQLDALDAKDEQVLDRVDEQITKTAIQSFGQTVENQIIEENGGSKLTKKLEKKLKEKVDEHAPRSLEEDVSEEVRKQILELTKACELNTNIKAYLQHPIINLFPIIRLVKTDTHLCGLFKDVYVKLPTNHNLDTIGKLMLIAKIMGEQAGTSFCKSLCAKTENILMLAKPIKSIYSVYSSISATPILSFGISIICGALTGIYNAVAKEEPQKPAKIVTNIATSNEEQKSKKEKISDLLHILSEDFKEILRIDKENISCIQDTIVKGTKFLMKDKKCGKCLNIMLNVVSKPTKVALTQITKGFAIALATKDCFYKYTGKIFKASAESIVKIAFGFVAHNEKDHISEKNDMAAAAAFAKR